MFQSKSILVVLLLAVCQIALAGTAHVNRAPHDGPALKHRTNAARMAAGLPPLAPAALQRRTGGGHGGWYPGFPGGGSPTQPNPGKPSGKPDCDDKKEVKLKCKKKGGNTIGYVSKDWSKTGKRGFGKCDNARDALKLDFENSVTPFDFKLSKGKESYDYLGFSGNNLNSQNSAILTGTKKTNRGHGPQNVGNAFSSWSANSASQIWHYSRSSKRVESEFRGTNGQSNVQTICYDPREDLFHLVSDVSAFKKRYTQAYEVEFELED